MSTALVELREVSVAAIGAIVSGVSRVSPPYTGDEHLYHDLGMESVKALNLLLTLEERFGVSLDDREFVKCMTIRSLVDLIQGAR